MIPHLQLTFLGGFQATIEGQPVSRFYSVKVQALLALLSIEANRSFSRSVLAGIFWPESPEAQALQSLRQALTQLRQLLGDNDRSVPFLLVNRQSIGWNPTASYQSDVADFLTMLAQGRWAQAIDRYGGELLDGFSVSDAVAFEQWTLVTREQLHRQAVAALESLIATAESDSDLSAAQSYLQRLLRLDPWREEAHRRLMAVYTRRGQPSAALAQFEECRRLLAEELDVPPSAETTALYREIRDRFASPAERATTDSVFQRIASPHNLPHPATPLLGRETALTRLCARLADPHCRLLTLTGLGGVGKSRLALAVAHRQSKAALYPGGVYWVSLAGVADGGDGEESEQRILLSLAAALPLTLHQGDLPLAQILHWIGEQKLLIILDNCEHLLSL